MAPDERGDEWSVWGVLPRVAGGAVALPVVVGFVTLGAAVIVARSLRDVARQGWTHVPSLRNGKNGKAGTNGDSHP